MVYAELGSAIPEAGGGYLWVKEGLPGPNGFLAGWMSWFAHAVAGSLYGVGFGGFIYELLRILFLDPAAHHDEHAGVFMQGPLHLPFGIELTEAVLVQKLFAVLIILLFLYINYRGTSETRRGRQHRDCAKGHHHWHIYHQRLVRGFWRAGAPGILPAI